MRLLQGKMLYICLFFCFWGLYPLAGVAFYQLPVYGSVQAAADNLVDALYGPWAVGLLLSILDIAVFRKLMIQSGQVQRLYL